MQPNPYDSPQSDASPKQPGNASRFWWRVGSSLLVLAFIPAGFALSASWKVAPQSETASDAFQRVMTGTIVGGVLSLVALGCFHFSARIRSRQSNNSPDAEPGEPHDVLP